MNLTFTMNETFTFSRISSALILPGEANQIVINDRRDSVVDFIPLAFLERTRPLV